MERLIYLAPRGSTTSWNREQGHGQRTDSEGRVSHRGKQDHKVIRSLLRVSSDSDVFAKPSVQELCPMLYVCCVMDKDLDLFI